MNIRVNHEPQSTLSPISIADIVFLLLIFFLLTSTYVLEPGIKIKLPGSTSAEVTSKKEIQVTITREGQLFLNDRSVGFGEFSTLLKEALEKSEDKLIILRADKSCELDKVIRILDMAREVGGEKFLIATRRIE